MKEVKLFYANIFNCNILLIALKRTLISILS